MWPTVSKWTVLSPKTQKEKEIHTLKIRTFPGTPPDTVAKLEVQITRDSDGLYVLSGNWSRRQNGRMYTAPIKIERRQTEDALLHIASTLQPPSPRQFEMIISLMPVPTCSENMGATA